MEYFFLALPWLLNVLMFAICLCLYKRKWLFVGILCTTAFFLNYMGGVVSFHATTGCFSELPVSFRVLSWNIHGMDAENTRYRDIAMKIRSEEPDIVFISELSDMKTDVMDSILMDIYKYRTTMFMHSNHYLYSRYPILNSTHFKVDGGNGIVACSCISINDFRIDVYGCHLTSNNMKGTESIFDYLNGISEASRYRVAEAECIIEDIAKWNTVHVVMGDMNDVTGSPAMNMLESCGLKDAWSEGGCGYGATIHIPLPYRIDHIMYCNSLKLGGIRKIDAEGLSDHDALVADFVLDNLQ